MAGDLLLIIDPQVDFHPGGTLAVTGADKDAIRISKMIRENHTKIKRIVITLDSHHRIHIAHSVFWKDKAGKNPAPFTQITAADIESGKWMTTIPEFADHSLKYAKELERQGRFIICIWPEHCLIGSPGHAITKPILDAVLEWSAATMKEPYFVLKGQNILTEMYSALKAEVPIPTDSTTALNRPLCQALTQASRILVCGQALSHCVNYTVRDLADNWPAGRMQDIVLLTDGSSPVPTFEAAGVQFLKDMKEKGLSQCLIADAFK